MRSFTNVSALIAIALVATPALAAEGIAFKHEKTVYADAKDAPLKNPEGVGCDDNGAFVVADTGNGRLLTYSWKNASLSGGAEVKLRELAYPVRVQVDSKGNVLVLDRKVKRIGRVDVKGLFAGYLEIKPAAGAPGVIPAAFKLDASDNVYVLDIAARRVVVLNARGEQTREVPLPREGVFTDVAADPSGRVYAVESVRAAVWAAEPGAAGFKDLTNSLKDHVSFPAYVAVVRGKLFLVDQNGMAVVVVGQDGTYQGRQLSLGWTDGLLYYPGQICVNANGDAFVADRQNNRVQVFGTAK